MIVQTAIPSQPHFTMLQTDHALMSGQFAKCFGNDIFNPLCPEDLIEYVITHHDAGWVDVDAKVLRDPATDLPYHLTKTPIEELLYTSPRSPNFNEAHHPLCGIISSMHTYGLYSGRYGLSDFIFIDKVPEQYKNAMFEMLQAELDRQTQLTARLRLSKATGGWVTKKFLYTNYKLLQFFDTLALYFQTNHVEARGETVFKNVPKSAEKDADIVIRPINADTYALSPYPFKTTEVVASTKGRYLSPQPKEVDLGDYMMAQSLVEQTVRLVPA